jgi:hypothetical protein
MKPLKQTFFIAAAVLLGLLPQGAQASCSGDACSAYSVENKTFSSSDKKFHATLLNKDQSKKIHLKGCMSVPGKFSGYCWDVTIEPGKRQTVENGLGALTTPEEAAKNFVVDISSAEFLKQPAANPPSEPTKPTYIKVDVVNGEPEPLLATIRDVDDNNTVIADRTLWNAAPLTVTLKSKEGKGHLRWSVSTMRKSGAPPPRCGDGAGYFTAGEKAIVKVSGPC